MFLNSLPLSDKPPISGEIFFEINLPPVSLQSKGERKRKFKDEISKLILEAGFLLSGDIQIEIRWHIHRQKRYELSSCADVDNIIKPILDSLSGMHGILIDDTQVQSISCYWVDSYIYEEEKVDILIQFFSGEFIPKSKLIFIDYGNNICFPLWESFSEEEQLFRIKFLIEKLSERENEIESGKDYFTAMLSMPLQRIFNKHRLKDFKVISIAEKLKELT